MKMIQKILENENSLPLIKQAIEFEPEKLNIGAWTGHMPFAYWFITLINPNNYVELGTYSGDSYFTVCQAVLDNKLDTECYAVDTWNGDEQTGFYGPKIFHDFITHHEKKYTAFSHLLRMTFDEAVSHFSNGSIDLLHIDGLHTYEAAKHDFDTWKPKMSSRGIILLHDIMVRKKAFGVWKLWEELKELYPHIEFHHSHGLGVLFVGDDFPPKMLSTIKQILSYHKLGLFNEFFASLGQGIHQKYEIGSLNQAVKDRDEQINDLQKALQNRDAQIVDLDKTSQDQNEQITDLKKSMQDRDEQITDLNQELQERDAQITELNQAVLQGDAAEKELQSILLTKSWKITEPARTIMRGYLNYRYKIHKIASHLVNAFSGKGYALFVKNSALSWYRRNRRLPKIRELYDLTIKARIKYRQQIQMNISHKDSDSDLKSRLEMTPGEPPLISVVMPVYNTPINLLRLAVNSVTEQIYQNWELCICDDGSENPILSKELLSLKQADNRIKILSNESNSGISHATNSAAKLASGDFVAFLDHDDELTPDALGEMSIAIRSNPLADVFYSDQDKIDEKGSIIEQFHKPDWSPDYFRRVMYVGHLLVVRKTLIDVVGGFDSIYDGVQDYEFMLRISEKTSKIVHIQKILYHWRAIQGSIADSPDAKGKIDHLQCKAVKRHLNRYEVDREVVCHPKFSHRVNIGPLRNKIKDKVSIIIPTKDQPEYIRRCLQSIYRKSTYDNFEVIVIDNNTTDKEAIKVLNQYPVRIISFPDAFNYSKVNNLGVENSTGDVVVMLNNDIEIVTEDWLEILLSELIQKDVGAVGPLLLYPDKSVQHAGIVLGARGTADHVMRSFPSDCDGYAGSLSCTREVSAVTGACLMTRKITYIEYGGLDENYGTHYQDTDFCLKLLSDSYRILHVPDAQLIHYESATRGDDYDLLDRLLFQDKWEKQLAMGDPYFHPAFSLNKLDYSLRGSE